MQSPNFEELARADKYCGIEDVGNLIGPDKTPSNQENEEQMEELKMPAYFELTTGPSDVEQQDLQSLLDYDESHEKKRDVKAKEKAIPGSRGKPITNYDEFLEEKRSTIKDLDDQITKLEKPVLTNPKSDEAIKNKEELQRLRNQRQAQKNRKMKRVFENDQTVRLRQMQGLFPSISDAAYEELCTLFFDTKNIESSEKAFSDYLEEIFPEMKPKLK